MYVYIRVPTQVLQNLIFVFPSVRLYKVLFMVIFAKKGLIEVLFFIQKEISEIITKLLPKEAVELNY